MEMPMRFGGLVSFHFREIMSSGARTRARRLLSLTLKP